MLRKRFGLVGGCFSARRGDLFLLFWCFLFFLGKYSHCPYFSAHWALGGVFFAREDAPQPFRAIIEKVCRRFFFLVRKPGHLSQSACIALCIIMDVLRCFLFVFLVFLGPGFLSLGLSNSALAFFSHSASQSQELGLTGYSEHE